MWKDWLTFSKGERYGIVVLATAVLILIALPYFQTLWSKKPIIITSPQHSARIDSFLYALKFQETDTQPPFSFEREESKQQALGELFPFDPNTITIPNLERLGFTHRQAVAIDRYRGRYQRFRTPSDFAKLYVVDSATFARLEPYIHIEAPQDSSSGAEHRDTDAHPKRTVKAIVVELNTADTLKLMELRGIGRGYARRIVSYREMLGGFHSIDQLEEIYGLPKSLVLSLRESLAIDTSLIRRIDMNIISYNDLRRHPYITDYQARAIIYFRETIGAFEHPSDILGNRLVDSATYRRIQAYLSN